MSVVVFYLSRMIKHITACFVLFLFLNLATAEQNFFKSFFYRFETLEKHYIAVVEYRPFEDPYMSVEDLVNKNAEEYINLVRDVSQEEHIMMFIFPESTLDNVKTVKDLKRVATKIKNLENPCTTHVKQYPAFMRKLACAARNFSTTLVFNVVEESDFRYYTADVVINPEGRIELSIRREIRIGASFLHNYPIAFAIPSKVIFIITKVLGYDLQVVYPFSPTSFVTGFSFSFDKAISLADYRQYVICSNWISQLPFLTSLQVHQMWAQEFNITIYFSGANNPKKGQGGTGIYDSVDGPVIMDVAARGHTRHHVYNLMPSTHTDNDTTDQLVTPRENRSVDELAQHMDFFQTQVDPDLHRYQSVVLNPQKTSSRFTLCYDMVPENYFCCEFNIKIKVDASDIAKDEYIYHFVAYKGYKSYYDVFQPGGVEICAVIACLTDQIGSCGQRFKDYERVNWPITFEKILIRAKFGLPKKEKVYYSTQFPSSLLSSLRPLLPNATLWQWKIVDTGNSSFLERTFMLIEPQNRLLTFGIFGRNFTLVDYPNNNSIVHKINLILILVVVYVKL